MPRLIIIIAVVTLAAGAVLGQQSTKAQLSNPRERDIREIELLEAEWNTINEVSDAEGKRRLLADDSYHVGPSGRLYNKIQDLEATRLSYEQKQATNSIVRFFVTNRNIRFYDNVAVVTASGSSITTRDGQERRGNSFRSVHVWEKRDGSWQIVVDQVTGVAK